MCCLAKMTFNKSHLSMCMVTCKGHFNTTRIYPGGSNPAGERARARGAAAPLPPLAPPVQLSELLCLLHTPADSGQLDM